MTNLGMLIVYSYSSFVILFFFSSRRRHTRSSTVSWAGDVYKRQVLADPELAPAPKWVLGGGSNIILTGDVKTVVLKLSLIHI